MMFGFWRIFRELIWASFKAFLIVILLSTIEFSLLFNQLEAGNYFESLWGSILVNIFGFILVYPSILPFLLAIGTPITYYLLKKGCAQRNLLILVGALSSVAFLKFLPMLFSGSTFSIERLMTGNIYFLIGGGFTGLFFYQQISKISKSK